MSSVVILHRYLWFHNEVKQGKHPNARKLAEEFEISPKTAQRSIEFLSERLKAPLVYVSAKRGYTYEDNTWELPGLWLHEDELVSLVLSESSTRDILPLHLFNYMGTWHIIAHCNVKNELRDFVLSRIKGVTGCGTPVNACVEPKAVQNYIRQTFGIFRGRQTEDVCLRFAEDIAPWIAEQSWHPDQKVTIEKDGRLCLTLPVADFREIKREILRYGAQVEVLSPAALRNEVKKEIENMRKIYS